MANESRGFDYSIEIRDKFSKALEAFKAGLKKAKEGFKEFRGEVSSLGSGTQKLKQELSSVASETRKLSDTTQKQAVTSKQAFDAQAAQLRTFARVNALVAAEAENLRKATAAASAASRAEAEKEVAAIKKKQAALNDLAVAQARASILAKAPATLQQAQERIGVRANEISEFQRAQQDTELNRQIKQASEEEKRAAQEVLAFKQQLQRQTAREVAEIQAFQKQKEIEAIKQISEAKRLQAKKDRDEQIAFNKSIRDASISERGQVREASQFSRQQARATQAEVAQVTAYRDRVEKLRQEQEKFQKSSQTATKEIDNQDAAMNRISFTFRRLIGIYVVFTGFRLFVNQLKEAVKSSIDFNAQIEASTLGISALFLATSKVANPTGQATTATEAFAAATAEARRQVALLRKDALLTAATFPELVKAYQTAVAPGAQAGLTPEQTRKFTVLISQAAAALGQPQEGLPEEIRSLLQGTISARNTRIATSLGITNDDIKRAKEMGVLFQFLEARFSAFAKLSEEGLKTFSVRLSNAKDALLTLLSSGFGDFFTRLSNLIDDISKKFVSFTKEGVVINPQALKAVEILGTVLSTAVDEAKRLMETLSAQDAASNFQTVADVLNLIIRTLSAAVEGIVKGLAVVGSMVQAILAPIKLVADILGVPMQKLLALLIEGFVILKGIQLVWITMPAKIINVIARILTMNTLLGISLDKVIAVGSVFSTMGKEAIPLLATLGAIAAAITAVFFLFNGIKDRLTEITGLQGSWSAAIKASIIELGALVKFLGRAFLDFANTMTSYVISGIAKAIQFLLTEVTKVPLALLEAFSFVVPGMQPIIDKVKDSIKDLSLALDAVQAEQANKQNAGGGFWERQKTSLMQARQEGVDAFKAFATAEGAAGSEANSLVAKIKEIPGIIGNSAKSWESLKNVAETMQQDLESAQETLRTTAQSLGAVGAIQQQLAELTKSRIEQEKQGRTISAERVQAEKALLQYKAQEESINQKLGRLSTADRNTAYEILAATKQVLDLQHQLSLAETQTGLASEQVVQAKATGNPEAITKAQEELSKSAAHTEALKNDLEISNKLAESLVTNLPTEKFKQLSDLALGIVQAQGLQLDSERRINEAKEQAKKLETATYEIAKARIATIGAKEFDDAQRRLVLLDLQVRQAQRLTQAGKSQNTQDSTLAAAQNQVDAEETQLKILKEINQKQVDALRFLISATKFDELRVALLKQLAQQIKQNILSEAEQAEKAQAAADVVADIRRKSLDAQKLDLLALSSSTAQTAASVKTQKELLDAKKTTFEFDDKLARARGEEESQKIKIAAMKEEFALRQQMQVALIASTVDTVEKAAAQARLNAVTEDYNQQLKQQNLALKLAQAETRALIKEELSLAINRGKENIIAAQDVRVDTKARAESFQANQQHIEEQKQLAAATGAIAIEERRLENMRKEFSIQENTLRAQIASTNNLVVQGVLYLELLTLQDRNKAELKGQEETLAEMNHDLLQIIDKIETPVEAGIFEGMRQFMAEAPSQFQLTVDLMKNALHGLADVAADTFTSLFDPRNTTTLKERIGQLGLELANEAFKGIFENLFAKILEQFLAAKAKAQLASVSADLLSSAAGVGVFAKGGYVWPGHYRTARSFARGGQEGSGTPDPTDTINAKLGKGEFVFDKRAVNFWGRDTLETMKNLLEGPQISRTPDPQIGRPGADLVQRKPSTSPQSAPKEKREILPVLPVTPHLLRQMLDQSGTELSEWLTKQGYQPGYQRS